MIPETHKKQPGVIDTVVIGAGHAGLAVSYCLTERSMDHVVLERGEVANSWRQERWDSLKLLTPNWQTQLPGYGYSGDDPDGYMGVQDLVGFIEGYARHFNAPVQTLTMVTSVSRISSGYHVVTNRGSWLCRSVVIASGACNLPGIPAMSAALPDDIEQLTSQQYRKPGDLKQGGVLVVGASSTGLQLAEEITRSGRKVTIAAGEHVRIPRVYRGRDIQWWMDKAGVLDEGQSEIDDIKRVRRLPSPQLIGSRRHPILDLNVMQDIGVKVVGRLMGLQNGVAQFSGSLKNVCALADLKMNRLLNGIDEWIENNADLSQVEPTHRFDRTRIDDVPCLGLDLAESKIRSVIWATGYRPDYSWLDVPVTDAKGMLRHDSGVVDTKGLYVVGLPFLRQRKSSYIHGAEDDARFVTQHLCTYLKR